MACYKPLTAYRSPDKGKNGRMGITFHRTGAYSDMQVKIPCGQCIGCRLERSRQWAIRIMHEAKMHEENSFITLTYNPEHMPTYGSLVKSDFQNFVKRLRKEISPKKIRYYHCGEYGENFGRPHYHAIIFGLDFPDKVGYNCGKSNYKSSKILEKLWPYGFNTVGEVTFESASYCARYIMKKITGNNAQEHYMHLQEDTGEIIERLPEYTTMSLKPGIGQNFFDKFKEEIYNTDSVIMRGKEMKPPKFYDIKYEIEQPEVMCLIKDKRCASIRDINTDFTPERLAVKEQVAEARLNQFKRSL